jgi:ABC-type transporter MlaC component
MGRAIRTKNVAGYLLLASALALAIPTSAQSQGAIDAFVHEIGDSLRAIQAQANGNAAQLLAGCREFLGRALNLEAMAHAASEETWERMSATQRDGYEAAFAQRLARECARELAGGRSGAVTLAGVRTTQDGDKLATLRVGDADNVRMIAWRLREAGEDKFVATDVIWEGHSAIAKARDDFAATLQGTHGNIDALIEMMRK